MKEFCRQTRISRRLVAVLLTVCMLLPLMPVIEVAAEDTYHYIYLDLAAGNITINASSYTGYQYVKDGETGVYTATPVTETKQANTRFYIYQTNKDDPKTLDEWRTLSYTDIQDKWMINQTDIDDVVIKNWEIENTGDGTKTARVATSNYITVNAAATIVLDNVWSTYYSFGQGRKTAGLAITKNGHFTTQVLLKGDNRLVNVLYCETTTGKLIFDSFDETKSSKGTLLVASNPVNYGNHANQRVGVNHYDSVIGANDNDTEQDCLGLVFQGGTIFAGARTNENCAAIGAGGNGIANIQITSGSVTAVTSSTGAAIGGGIGIGSPGGAATVTIEGGNVYAYNYGCNFTKENGGVFIPGIAIGGGSSRDSQADKSTVNISGGTIYAYSLGGTAIGAGNSVKNKAAEAIINISGGHTTAVSVGGSVPKVAAGTDPANNNIVVSSAKFTAEAGTAIGGGTSTEKTGGAATVTITGGLIHADGIGGGNSTQALGGNATVAISGGTVIANGIGGGFSVKNGYSEGSKVIISGGSVNSMIAATPKNAETNGDMIYLTRVNLYMSEHLLPEGYLISELKLDLPAGKTYGVNDIYTDEVGVVYLWLPEDSAVVSAKIEVDGVEESFVCEEADMKIDAKDIGALECKTPSELALLNITTSDLYGLFYDSDCTKNFAGTVVVKQRQSFTYYIKVDEILDAKGKGTGKYYDLYGYYAMFDTEGNAIMQNVTTLPGQNAAHKVEMSILQDTQVWYRIHDTVNNKQYFAIDLTNGHITVTSDENGRLIIDQNGYKISGFEGTLLISSSGYPTSNTVTVNMQDPTHEVDIQMDNINVCASGTVLDLECGTVNLTFGDADNMIRSTGQHAINVEEDGTLNLTFNGKDSVKIDGADNNPAIKGAGTVCYVDGGGFLKLNTQQSTGSVSPDLLVGSYLYVGDDPSHKANLFDGNFDYGDPIGYVNNKDNDLHPVTDLNADNTDSFSARGIAIQVGNLKLSSQKIVSGDYQIVVKQVGEFHPEAATLMYWNKQNKAFEIIPLEDVNYLVQKSDAGATMTVTIEGSTFKTYGNLLLIISAVGEIPITTGNYEGEYDGNAHSITVALDTNKFKIYYYGTDTPLVDDPSTPEIEIVSTVMNGGYTTFYTQTDVGTYYVYWYAFYEGTDVYQPTYGVNTITIKQAANLVLNDLKCPHIYILKDNVNGEHNSLTTPKPSFAAKWGTNHVEYKYYSDKECQTQIFDTSYLEVNKEDNAGNPTYYYVVAVIPEPDPKNYEGLTSKVVSFQVRITQVFYSNTRELNKIEQNAAEGPVVTANGAFTLFFNVEPSEDLYLAFDKGIGNAYITMITFEADGTPTYYYQKLEMPFGKEDALRIQMTNFFLMGTTDKFFVPNSNIGEYQFCIDMAEDQDGALTFTVSFGTESQRTGQMYEFVEKAEARFETLDTSHKMEQSVEGDTVSIHVHPFANGNAYKIFSVIIRGESSDGDDAYNITMSNDASNAAEKAINLKLIQGRLFVFQLADTSQAFDEELTLTITNLKPGDYTIECYVQSVEFDPSQNTDELAYVLASNNINTYDKVVGDPLTVMVQNPQVHVEKDGERVLTSREASVAQTYTVTYSGVNEAIPTIRYAVVKKPDRAQDMPTLDLVEDGAWKELALTSVSNGSGMVSPVMPVTNGVVEPGAYRIYFNFYGEIFELNLIVTE